jgi:hypothetical protein
MMKAIKKEFEEQRAKQHAERKKKEIKYSDNREIKYQPYDLGSRNIR